MNHPPDFFAPTPDECGSSMPPLIRRLEIWIDAIPIVQQLNQPLNGNNLVGLLRACRGEVEQLNTNLRRIYLAACCGNCPEHAGKPCVEKCLGELHDLARPSPGWEPKPTGGKPK